MSLRSTVRNAMTGSSRGHSNQNLEHYLADRCQQGLGNELIVPPERPPDVNADLETTERFGGLLLRSYRGAA